MAFDTGIDIVNESKYLSAGFQSVCYLSQNEVIKRIPISHRNSLESVRNDYQILRDNLGDYVIETDFYSNSEKFSPIQSIIARQVFFEGQTFWDVIDNHPSQDQLNAIKGFFRKCLEMFHASNKMPDLFGRPHLISWYNPINTPNALISKDKISPNIKLVDVGFSRLSKNNLIGPVHNRLLAKGLRNALDYLEKF